MLPCPARAACQRQHWLLPAPPRFLCRADPTGGGTIGWPS